MSDTKNSNETQQVDFFSLTEGRNFDPNKEARCYRLELPTGLTPEECLKAYYAAGFPKGSHRAGVIEIQSNDWVAETTDRKRMDFAKKPEVIVVSE